MNAPTPASRALNTSLAKDLIALGYAAFTFYMCQLHQVRMPLGLLVTLVVGILAAFLIQSVFDESVSHIEQSGFEAGRYARFTAFTFFAILGLCAIASSLFGGLLFVFLPVAALFAYPYLAVWYADRYRGGGMGSRAPRSSPFSQQGTSVSFGTSNPRPRISLLGGFLRSIRNRTPRPKTPNNPNWDALIKKGYFDDD
ncbi:MAG TPA: hypothetical protein PKY51_10125 [Fimbriimonadaceae bacterium]|jgi:hypothetical protein|nr:hypothetical protein [Fimbriimonadaceae bacterium]